jgi:nitrite reductase/ring-hydroxylating ferredoxin subunit
MKRVLLIFPLILIFLGCSSDDDLRQNPYLPHLNFSVNFDLSLPEYNQLNFPGNKYITRNYGINGIVIFNLNNDQYLAYELTDPNHVPQACSSLTVDGTEATCSCGDGNKYTIITGQQTAGEGEYTLKPYRVQRVGSVLQISN